MRQKKGQVFLDFSRIFWSFVVGFIIGVAVTLLLTSGLIELPIDIPFIGSVKP